jgi:alpha-L-rhamnosidase
MFFISKCFTNNCDKKIIVGDNRISFGWQLKSDKNNTVQSDYELVVLDDKKEAIWHSGKVKSSKSLNVIYEGPELGSKREYFWRVTVWSNYGEMAESDFISFEMGLIKAQDWKAKWIEAKMPIKSLKEQFNPAQIFSYHPNTKEIENIPLDPPVIFIKDFNVESKEIVKARLYITANGVYEAELNGEKIGDEYLAPGFSSYPKLQYYQTHDITNRIKNLNNEFKITVADGWYKGKIGLAGIGHQFGDKVALLAQIEIEYVDGERKIIGTDCTFRATTGEIEYSDLFIGEKQNHNINQSMGYFEVKEVDYGYDQLKADLAEPIRCIEKIKAVNVIVTPNGDTVIDFGRNIAGIVEVRVKGLEGEVVELQHTEELDAEGNFFFNIIGQNKFQTDTYILKGGEEEIFIPKFTYHGFRYVKVVGYPGEIKTEKFTAYVLSSCCERAGKITTSNPKINKLLDNIYHSQESNFISVPTDCPQREKGGWTGDAQIYTPTAIFNMNINRFMQRWLENMRVDQYENGQIPGLIPWIKSDMMLSSGFGNISSAGWADACIIIPWHLYVQYEDINFLKDNYQMMKKWMNYVEKRCASNVTQESEEYEKCIWDMDFHYGDWFIPSLVNEDGSPNPMISAKLTGNQVATMYFAYSSELLSNIASILGEEEDSEYYSDLSKKVKAAFNQGYIDERGKIVGNLQGLYALAAYFNMGDDETNKKLVERLVQKIEENGDRLDTGFLATPILLDVLTSYGRKELAYKLLLQEDCPSWLYMVNQGATSIWESWDAIKPDGNRNTTSFNHYSLGSVEDYIVRKIIGLNKVSEEEAKFIIEPDLEAPFNYCRLSYESPYGNIKVEWELNELKGQVSLEIPVGLNVAVKLPNKDTMEFGAGIYKISI